MDVIIGAGISGLSYACFSKNKSLILEKDSEIGGYCKTIKKNGFVWDYSGHFFHFQNKAIEDFICKNIEPEQVAHCEKHTQIKYKNQYVDFPFQKNIHQLSKEELIDCLYDLFATTGGEYNTFKQMLYAKFGKSIAEKFLIPYNEKLYACDLDLLDVDAMGRFFPYADKEDIIKNFKNSNNSSYNSNFTYPRGGAIEYVNSLASHLDYGTISTNESVMSIDIVNKVVETNKRHIKYDNLISTIPFPILLDYCGINYDKNLYSWNKVLVFNLGFDKKGADRNNNWVYFPDKELSFYRIGYYDNIFNSDKLSLYVELGFGKDVDNIDVQSYKLKVLRDLQIAGITTDHKLVADHYVLMDPAYVHISKNSIIDVKMHKIELAKHDIYSIGRYGSWTYCSIEDNILEAKTLANMIK